MVERQRVATVLTATGWCLLLADVTIGINFLDQTTRVDGFAAKASTMAAWSWPPTATMGVAAGAAALTAELLRSGYPSESRLAATPLAVATIAVAALGGVVTVGGAWSLVELDTRGELSQLAVYIGGLAVLAAAVMLATLAVRVTPAPVTNGAPHGHHRPASPFAQPPEGHHAPSSPSR
jgi:hypothetical protein